MKRSTFELPSTVSTSSSVAGTVSGGGSACADDLQAGFGGAESDGAASTGCSQRKIDEELAFSAPSKSKDPATRALRSEPLNQSISAACLLFSLVGAPNVPCRDEGQFPPNPPGASWLATFLEADAEVDAKLLAEAVR